VKRVHAANAVTGFFFLSRYDFLKPVTERFSAGGFSASARGQGFPASGNLCRQR